MKKDFEVKCELDDTVLTILSHTQGDTTSIHLSSESEGVEWGIHLTDKSMKQLIKELKFRLKAKVMAKTVIDL
jgi:hypothetical protein